MKVKNFKEFINEDIGGAPVVTSSSPSPAYSTLSSVNGAGPMELPTPTRVGSGDLALQIGDKPKSGNRILIKNKKYYYKKHKNKIKKGDRVSLVGEEDGEEFFNGTIDDIGDKKFTVRGEVIDDEDGNDYTIFFI
jgi:hypothetical protein